MNLNDTTIKEMRFAISLLQFFAGSQNSWTGTRVFRSILGFNFNNLLEHRMNEQVIQLIYVYCIYI